MIIGVIKVKPALPLFEGDRQIVSNDHNKIQLNAIINDVGKKDVEQLVISEGTVPKSDMYGVHAIEAAVNIQFTKLERDAEQDKLDKSCMG